MDAHARTWTTIRAPPTVPDTSTLSATTTGTKAGDPLSDICFNAAAARFIRTLPAALANQGLAPATSAYNAAPAAVADHDQPQDLPDFTFSYIDAIVTAIAIPSDAPPHEAATTATTAVVATGHAHKLNLKFKPGKTEAKIHFNAPRS